MNKLFFRLFCRKGYGVHSPFVFSLITKVIEEKHPYYAYGDIETHFKNKSNCGRLMFRLVNYFGCGSTAIIGDSPSSLCLYPAMASLNNKCYVIGSSEGISRPVGDFIAARNLHNIRFDEDFIPEENDSWTLIALNRASPANVEQLTRDRTILLINNIRKDAAMRDCWNAIKNHERNHITIDMYHAGMILFDDKLPMKNHKTYYNYD